MITEFVRFTAGCGMGMIALNSLVTGQPLTVVWLCIAVIAALWIWGLAERVMHTRVLFPPPPKPACRHDNRVPVRSVPLPGYPQGELVAQWCPDCESQLEADWRSPSVYVPQVPALLNELAAKYEQQPRYAHCRCRHCAIS